MKRVLVPGLLMLGGIAMGGLTVQGLHAQANRPVYLVAEITVTNPKAYATEYAPKIQASVKAAGGHLIALGGGGGARAGVIKGLEGKPPQRVAIQRWDSMGQFQAWWNSKARKDARKIGGKYASFHEYVVEGLRQ